MTDREKLERVINGLECCKIPFSKCYDGGCPYYENEGCKAALKTDALALLKEQESVKPTWRNGYPLCGGCGFKLHWIVERNNYCPQCGRAVKWDE